MPYPASTIRCIKLINWSAEYDRSISSTPSNLKTAEPHLSLHQDLKSLSKGKKAKGVSPRLLQHSQAQLVHAKLRAKVPEVRQRANPASQVY
jgi:hypothetical protein